MPVRVAVIGCGAFGANHLRVVSESANAQLVAAVDANPERAAVAAAKYNCAAFTDPSGLHGVADAAIVATPTTTHAAIACPLLEVGLDVLVEKPIAGSIEEGRRIVDTAAAHGRVLAVGHLERFNPAIRALQPQLTTPLFFEIHRMNLFAPRSLDVDVILDLMIHDIDLVLAMTGLMPEEVRAAGIRILSQKVDIAHVRLAFPGGCVANLTASRVSTERVRKLRLFQPHRYFSVDYAKQEGLAISVGENQQIGFQPLKTEKREPLAAQFDAFLDAIEQRAEPPVSGPAALRALEVSIEILAKIEEHAAIVNRTLSS